MIINRRELLGALDACAPGLGKENIEQGQCYVFEEGKVFTFNDLILCQQDVVLDITGAVPAKPLRETLAKLTEEELTITTTDSEVRIKGAGRRSVIKFSPEVYLPTGSVETPTDWIELPPAFADALPLVADCASKDGDPPELDCVLLEPGRMIACDRSQAIVFEVATGVTSPTLISAIGCKAVTGLGVAEVSVGESWLHWKTYSGLQVSVRKTLLEYPDGVDDVFQQTSDATIELPATVVEAMQRAAPFFADSVDGKQAQFCIAEGKAYIRAKNHLGWYEETKGCDYSGPKIEFSMNPKYIASLVKHDIPCSVTQGAIVVRGDSFSYAVSIKR